MSDENKEKDMHMPKHSQKRQVKNAMTKHLSTDDRLLHLAEEACELGHAALKLARVRKGTNPADVDLEQARKNLIEEYADVLYCADSLDLKPADNWYIKRQFRAQTRFEANDISKNPIKNVSGTYLWMQDYSNIKKP